MREELEINRNYWDEATEIHTRGNVYGIDEFKSGLCRLHRVEVEEVGDVRGKSLLHLQCHFGIDTLSWARRGAKVTGIDFSPQGIESAKHLSTESNVPADFICSNIYDLPNVLKAPASFDIVYTSYGAINWLPDLAQWGEIISHFLKPGGFFYIAEAHPTARMFPTDDDAKGDVDPRRPFFPYFHDPAGIRWPGSADYANPNAVHKIESHEWQHSMGAIINSLIDAGLTIEWLHEFPYCAGKLLRARKSSSVSARAMRITGCPNRGRRCR